jgi:membrane-bound lytic murein transglycosylase D
LVRWTLVFVRAGRRLPPLAAVFVLLFAGQAARVCAQALDSVADSATGPTALAEDVQTPAPLLEPLASSALPHGLIGLPVSGQALPVPLNQRVLSYVELFQGRLHEYMESGLRRGSQYLPMIQQVFRTEGLPLDLAYVPLIESAFRPEAISRASAKGVWQFMKGTALENGLRHDWYIDERSDPEKATVAAANYLKTLAELFGGDWHLALASYNGGPTRVQRALRSAGQTDFWGLSAKSKVLPRETREYVPMILAAIIIARNPAQYGFSFQSEERPAFEKVAVTRPVDLRSVAEWAGTPIATIHALNPELRRQTTPKDGGYELKVPVGTSAEVARRLTESADLELPSEGYYTVKRGEALPGIAKKLRVSRADLAEANNLRTNARLAAGQRLMVPGDVVPADSVHAASSSGATIKTSYEVRQGDTLYSIARLFDTSVKSIQTWNPGLSGSRVVVGQRLTVYKQQ